MLRKLTAFFTSLLVISSIYAQTSSPSKFTPGFKIGVNLSSFTKDVSPFDKTSPRGVPSGYSNYEKYFRIAGFAGFTGTYTLNPAFSLGAELLYTGRGAAYRGVNPSVIIVSNQGAEKAYDYYKYKIDYLELPLLARFNLSATNAPTNFIFYSGLAPAFSLNKKRSFVFYNTSGSSVIANQETKDEELPNVSSFNFSPVVGFQIGGCERQKGKFFIDFRFAYAVLPVFNQSKDASGSNLNTQMWTAGLSIGTHFR